jgi:prolipoprotein diacylglyceryltransferase
MYPSPVHLFGLTLDVWNFVFLLSIGLGFAVMAVSIAAVPWAWRPRWWPLSFVFTVYLSAIGAQLFAYAFDLNTEFLPPASIPWTRYYLDPLFGPKTLYGAVLVLPLGVLLACLPRQWPQYVALLDAWTPPMMATLAGSRVGCFLQGCCYGRRHDALGLSFPPGSPAHAHQVEIGLIARTDPSLPVLPAQGLEAIALFALAGWSLWAVRRRRPHVFLDGVAIYSLVRFALEFLRDDPDRNALAQLSTSQWIALAVLALYATWRGAYTTTLTKGLPSV